MRFTQNKFKEIHYILSIYVENLNINKDKKQILIIHETKVMLVYKDTHAICALEILVT